MLSLLSQRNFRLLWLGQLSSQSGDRLTQLILIALVATRAAGSTWSLAKVLVITSLPALILNPFAGALVDRWNRKRTMIFCDLIRAGVIFTLPWAAGMPSAVPFYFGVFLLFAVGAFFLPARLATIPDLVPPKQLAQANALYAASGLIGSTLILVIGAFLVEWAGAARSCWINVGSYLASASFILLIPYKHKPRTLKGDQASPRQILAEIGEGLRAVWRHAQTRRVAGLQGSLMAGAGASVVVGTVLVQQSLGSVTKDLGFLSLWMGIGMLIGSTLYGRWGSRLPPWRMLGMTFVGCGVALWIFVGAAVGLKSGAAVSFSAALLGIAIAPAGVLLNTLIHKTHPERLHGRIFSSLGVIINLSWISSMAVAGWLVERGGRGILLILIGGAFLVGGIGLWYTNQRSKEIFP